MATSAKSIPQLLEDVRLLGETQYRLVEAVRALAKKTVRPLSEEVKYGGIVFSCGVPFGGVYAYRAHVSVEFSHGARIADPAGLLEGGGKGRRHLKLHSLDDLAGKPLATYLALAVQAAREAG